ncbi:MAG: hypothetical protein HC810_04025 [Acaryochloridaceae cyanobacterium RL_2_7]|nr:hypothetical protein [Acaryochloridaceae cyanobacterium RL_2_7]
MVQKYPQNPVVVEGLFVLGRQDSQYWDQALKSFPAHPLSVAIALERLKASPDDLNLLRLVARHGFHLPDLKTYLKRLTDKHAAKLTPDDWHAVGLAYWEKLTYKEAGEAYAKAPLTPLNAYRAARGLQLGNKNTEAIAAYQKLIKAFPQSEEAAQAYIKLGSLIDPLNTRFQYLEKGIGLAKSQGRSHLVADGLHIKATLEGKLNQTQAQSATEKQLLTDYGQTEAAASLLWKRAQDQATVGNYAAARDSAWAITQSAPRSALAPKAAFSSFQWAKQSGNTPQQKQVFEFLWNQHPDSYYTWRAGSLSGWPVGDFKTVRNLKPTPIGPPNSSR